MSKFCASCGSSIEDGVAFCANCGAPTPTDSPAAAPVITAAPATAPASSPKNNKMVLVAGIAGIAIIAIIVIFLLTSVLGGYKKPIKEMMKASQISANTSYSSVKEYGKNIKYSVKFKGKEKLSEKKTESLSESHPKEPDISAA